MYDAASLQQAIDANETRLAALRRERADAIKAELQARGLSRSALWQRAVRARLQRVVLGEWHSWVGASLSKFGVVRSVAAGTWLGSLATFVGLAWTAAPKDLFSWVVWVPMAVSVGVSTWWWLGRRR